VARDGWRVMGAAAPLPTQENAMVLEYLDRAPGVSRPQLVVGGAPRGGGTMGLVATRGSGPRVRHRFAPLVPTSLFHIFLLVFLGPRKCRVSLPCRGQWGEGLGRLPGASLEEAQQHKEAAAHLTLEQEALCRQVAARPAAAAAAAPPPQTRTAGCSLGLFLKAESSEIGASHQPAFSPQDPPIALHLMTGSPRLGEGAASSVFGRRRLEGGGVVRALGGEGRARFSPKHKWPPPTSRILLV